MRSLIACVRRSDSWLRLCAVTRFTATKVCTREGSRLTEQEPCIKGRIGGLGISFINVTVAASLWAAGPIQGTACVWPDVRPAVVRPRGGLWLRKDPGTLLPQQRARLLLLLQVQLFAA